MVEAELRLKVEELEATVRHLEYQIKLMTGGYKVLNSKGEVEQVVKAIGKWQS